MIFITGVLLGIVIVNFVLKSYDTEEANRARAGKNVVREFEVDAICQRAIKHCLTGSTYFLSCQQGLENCRLARELR